MRDGRPLLTAMQMGDMTLAQGLIMARADPNTARDPLGRCALHLAATQGIAGLCRMLIRNGADADAWTECEGHTALHFAVASGHLTVLRVLLDSLASPNVHNFYDESPLSSAIHDNNINAIKHLLKARAQCDFHTSGGAPGDSLDAAAASFAPGDSSRPPSASAVLRATQRNSQRELVEELVVAGAEVSAKDADENQALHVAVNQGSMRVARLLLEKRADPNCANKELRTPMHFAAGASVGRAVRALAEYRADVNREDRQGLTPIQLAGDPVIIHQLRALGAHEGQGLGKSRSMPSLRTLGPKAAARPPRGRAAGSVLPPPLSTPTSPTSSISLPISPPISPSSQEPLTPAKRNGVRLPSVAWGTDT